MAASTTSPARVASAADVRAWAIAQGLDEGFGTRGRLSAEVVDAFNKGRRVKYVEGEAPVQTVTVEFPGTDARGRKRTVKREVPIQAARKYGQEQGLTTSTRGRLSTTVAVAYAQAHLV